MPPRSHLTWSTAVAAALVVFPCAVPERLVSAAVAPLNAQRTLPVAVPGVHPISGRRFAQVMGFQGAAWLDREERDIEEAPDRAIDALGLQPGSFVADIGAGSGYMSVRLAKRVGPKGQVYATDIQPEMIALLRQRLAKDRLANVVPVLSAVNDPKLPEGALDLELLVDVYHEFAEPQQMLRGMRRALKPTGRLVLLEYRKEDPNVPIREDHKMSVAEAKLEVEAEGFSLSRVDSRLPRQHILIFTRAN
jgi:SAM-dependent methyltransferase